MTEAISIFFGQREVQVSQDAQSQIVWEASASSCASQLHQTDDLVRGDFHGVGERAPGRTFAALVASVDVLPDHFADPGSERLAPGHPKTIFITHSPGQV